jgi:hypothetical protein
MMKMTARKNVHIDMDAFLSVVEQREIRNSAETRRCHFAQLRV